MAKEGVAAEKEHTAPQPDDGRKPQAPTELKTAAWKIGLKRAVQEFGRDECSDLAASLTYRAVMAIAPALLALVSLLGVVSSGQQTTDAILDVVDQLGPGDAADTLEPIIKQVTESTGAGWTLVIGLLGAMWSASSYVGAFGRAMNRVYQVDEGRSTIKLRVQMYIVTAILVLGAALVLFGAVMSGPVARSVGDLIGLGSTAVTVWNIAKWPVILLIVVFMIALLYYATPNVKQPKFRWMSLGAAIAILVWILASLGFGFYVANFGNYNKTYGSLAGVIIFLLWLWLTNMALLFGAEVDAEVERARQLQAGIKAEKTLQLPPRDTVVSEKKEKKYRDVVSESRKLRQESTLDARAEERRRARQARIEGGGASPSKLQDY
ncbi:YihY/virulence factor BrkB family protein [Blastococcus sp. Marseille-P5729]|uniref:YihY/virulence factor BrkB family protein n=1 Tax=Blastococcus sp. Marseille-P5729 TaxID=2086582 RepID=UPI001F40A366|nr:YihY/virulence factor BrkB family protein [Blastococcus sp. Marseille-P5729]